MLTLAPVLPVTGWRFSARLARDHYVLLDSNDYSVHPAVIGRRIEVTVGLDRVRVLCDGKMVADHGRLWGLAPDHLPPRARRERPRVAAGGSCCARWPSLTSRSPEELAYSWKPVLQRRLLLRFETRASPKNVVLPVGGVREFDGTFLYENRLSLPARWDT